MCPLLHFTHNVCDPNYRHICTCAVYTVMWVYIHVDVTQVYVCASLAYICVCCVYALYMYDICVTDHFKFWTILKPSQWPRQF